VHGVDLELVVQAALAEGAGQGGNEDGGRGEEHAVATLDGLEAEPDGEMGLAHPGRPEDYQVLPVLDEATHAEGLDLLAVDGRLIAEVETVQALDEGEAASWVRMVTCLAVLEATSSERTWSRKSAKEHSLAVASCRSASRRSRLLNSRRRCRCSCRRSIWAAL